MVNSGPNPNRNKFCPDLPKTSFVNPSLFACLLSASQENLAEHQYLWW